MNRPVIHFLPRIEGTVSFKLTASARKIARAILLVAIPITLFAHTANEPMPRDAKWLARHEALVAKAKQGGAELVFLGDSITEHWTTAGPDGGLKIWNERFTSLGALNLGISGDRTQHVLWRIEHGALDGLHPKLVVLMIGTNNTGLERDSTVQRNTVSEAIDGIRAVITAVTRKLPDSKLLVLGIFPHGAKPDALMRRQGEEINAALAGVHDGRQTFFLDIGKHFLGADGTLSADVSPDSVHLSEAGYRIWADAINEPVKALIAGRHWPPVYTESK